MAINFSELLSNEQKRNLIENRIAQFAAEGYQHTLNLSAAEKLEDEQLIEASQKAIETLTAAIETHEVELAALPVEVTQ
jgi:hypothetical protein